MTRVFSTSLLIASSPETVWETISDIARWPEWTPTVTSVDRLDDGPLRVGSRARLRQPRLPEATWEVTRVVEGRAFTWESRGPGVRTIGRHEIEPAPGGCQVRLSVEHAGPLGPLVALVWGRLTQRYVDMEADHLARRATPTTPA
jgi:uncharacterized membrane protein